LHAASHATGQADALAPAAIGASATGHDHSGTYARLDTIAASGKGFVNHGAVAGTARPTGYASVEWFGTVEPTNWIDGDTWNSPS
jgi:hypothetical protein